MEPDQIKSIEEMAGALMTPTEIAILLNQDTKKFVYQATQKPDSEIYIAYQKGRLNTKLELRKKVIMLAKAGSPQAEVLADKYLIDTENI
jgi:hypothetical protein